MKSIRDERMLLLFGLFFSRVHINIDTDPFFSTFWELVLPLLV